MITAKRVSALTLFLIIFGVTVFWITSLFIDWLHLGTVMYLSVLTGTFLLSIFCIIRFVGDLKTLCLGLTIMFAAIYYSSVEHSWSITTFYLLQFLIQVVILMKHSYRLHAYKQETKVV